MKQDHPDERQKTRNHTKFLSVLLGMNHWFWAKKRDKCEVDMNEIQSSIEDLEIFDDLRDKTFHFNMQHHEAILMNRLISSYSSLIRNPAKLYLDLRAWGRSHTLNLPKCSTIHIYLLHRSHSHSKPHHPSPPAPHHQVAITAPSTKSLGDQEIIHIRCMFLEIHSIKKGLYLFLPRSTLVALDCAAQAKRLGKCDRSVVSWFGFLPEMVGLIPLMEDIWLTSWYGKYIM